MIGATVKGRQAMASLKLIIGNRTYSSWSLRPWLAMKANGLEFEEELIPLDTPQFKATIASYGAAGRVPILIDGEVTVWDSLAIVEHLAERFPNGRHWWPRAGFLRAHARAAVAEMHSGFPRVRGNMPMNLRRTPAPVALDQATKDEIARIEHLWSEALRLSGGPFLYGDFSIADAFFAPVATRFRSYAVPLGETAETYVRHIHDWPDFRAWHEAALKEPWHNSATDAI